MMKLFDTTLSHIQAIELRAFESEIFEGNSGLEKVLAPHLRLENVGLKTMYWGRTLMCFFGFKMLNEGLAQVFLIPSKYIPEAPVSFARYMRKMLQDEIELRPDIYRVQTETVDDKLHNKWMMFMGFECEGVLRKYGRGVMDYRMWSILPQRRS